MLKKVGKIPLSACIPKVNDGCSRPTPSLYPSCFFWKSVQEFECYSADKPANKPTNGHTGENITSSAEARTQISGLSQDLLSSDATFRSYGLKSKQEPPTVAELLGHQK